MPSQYLDEFIRELRRDGDAKFRAHHGAPVIVVTRAEGESGGVGDMDYESGVQPIVSAETSGWRIQHVSLLNRVFAVRRGAFEKDAPVVLGRSEKQADIVIPDDSVSKRHCLFEAKAGGVAVTDCGSTNGTKVDGRALRPGEPCLLRGSETLEIGNFSFLYETADGFLAHLKRAGIR
ncbi:MAG TPA: FHA domain-containing protein [Polyangia bacterium]|jgi:S-DNA-T family DNA segregation ATPase FtsK/SpoIIIE|nr:FHA domain-containing protein [Polyangia bacterium]